MRVQVFGDCLAMSKDPQNVASDKAAIGLYLAPGSAGVEVRTATGQEDRRGIDYIATAGGGEVYVDAKRRRRGGAKFWKGGVPELTLEVWSKDPGPDRPGKVGWTRDPAKETDLVLFTWPSDECASRYVVPYHALRATFCRRWREWCRQYQTAEKQPNQCSARLCCGRCRWTSTCVFVPHPVVSAAMVEDYHVVEPTPEPEPSALPARQLFLFWQGGAT